MNGEAADLLLCIDYQHASIRKMLYALLVKGKALFFQVAAGRGQVGRGQCKMSVLAPPGFFSSIRSVYL